MDVTLQRRGARSAAALVIAGSLLLCAPARPAAAAPSGRLLDVADMPRGWHKDAISSTSESTDRVGCLAHLATSPRKGVHLAETYLTEAAGLPSFTEVLSRETKPAADWATGVSKLARCTSITFRLGTPKIRAAVAPLALPAVGASSSAYSLRFTIEGLPIVEDLVVFWEGEYDGFVEYGDTATPNASDVEILARAAVSKAEGRTVHVAALSITSVRESVAHTADGDVGYRAFGTGPPLVLITGYGGTVEGWDPRFVDALAQHFRVYIFDNAGIGRSSPLRHLTIDAMADQTGAFIAALKLSRPDVLGWSMGSMIAQALAVLHPSQVGRLVLCATYPGNGDAVVPPQKAINALNSGDSTKVLADLFPAGHKGAEDSYTTAIGDFPPAKSAPKKVVAAQATAIKAWWAGKDDAGRRAAMIAVPTLVADGTDDRLDPSANDHALAALVRGATLVLYPDAGHAFLFQDEAAFVPRVVSFLR
jgi:pimeloyl-ACP methyl ester carboxylesterase